MTMPTNLIDLTNDLLGESAVWNAEGFPFKAQVEPGHPSVMVVAGENSTGKSYFVECLRGWAHAHHKMPTVSVSIRERSGGGLYEAAGMRRAMMFGDETTQSTGATSVNVLTPAFNTLHGRIEDGAKTALLVLDEPELGLSDGYAAAMGAHLGQRALQMPDGAMLVVVTHSRGLAAALARELNTQPSFVKLGLPMGLTEWLSRPEQHSIEDLLNLREVGHAGRREVQRIQEALKPRKIQAAKV